MSLTATTAAMVDRLNNQITLRGYQDANGVMRWASVLELNGAQIGTANPLPMMHAGNTGVDWTLNKPSSLPPSGYTSAKTVPVNAARIEIAVENQSTDSVVLVLDDGLGNNTRMVVLAPALSQPGQGGGWSSTSFKGRLQVCVPTANAATDIVHVSEY